MGQLLHADRVLPTPQTIRALVMTAGADEIIGVLADAALDAIAMRDSYREALLVAVEHRQEAERRGARQREIIGELRARVRALSQEPAAT